MTKWDLLEHPDVVMGIRAAAGRVSRRYRAYISFDDLAQEAQIWVANHPRRVAETLPDPDAPPREQRAAYSRLVRLLERSLEAVARAEKAAASGYEPDDEQFYEFALIDELLPTLWDSDAIHNPPQVETGMPHGHRDPAEGPAWPAMVADIEMAWRRADLTPTERGVVSLRYGSGLTVTQVAEASDMSKETVIKHLRNAKYRVAQALHGVRPLRIPDEETDVDVD